MGTTPILVEVLTNQGATTWNKYNLDEHEEKTLDLEVMFFPMAAWNIIDPQRR